MKQIDSSDKLISQLKRTLNRQRLVLFFAGVLATLVAVLTSWLILSVLAQVMILPVWLKLSVLLAGAAATAYLFTRYALVRLFDGSIELVAVRLELRYPELKGRLVAAVQFAQREAVPGFSSDLLAAIEKQALEKIKDIDFNRVVAFNPVLRTGRAFAGAAILSLAMLFIFPGLFSYSYEVYSQPTKEVAPPVAYSLLPFPGSTELVKYRDIEIGGIVVGERIPEKAVIYHRRIGGSWQKTQIELDHVDRDLAASGDSLTFGITLRQIKKSFDYFVEAGRLKSEVQRVDVVDRPRVIGISLAIFYPDYTGKGPLTISENNGSFSAVVGSRVNMKIESNLGVESAELIFEDSSRLPLALTNKIGEVSLLVDKSRSYHIRLRDHLGERNPDPIEYYITAVPDEYPSVEVIRPGYDANLNDEMLVPFLVRIFDDYGFTSLALKYSIVHQGRPGEEHVAILHFPESIKTEGDLNFNWDLDRFNLFPGDYITYYFELADNDMISGPKVSKSRTYVVRHPSLDELIARTEQDSEERIVKTEELLKTGKELVDRLKSAGRKLQAQAKQQTGTDWQQQKELEAIVQKNEEMVRQIEKLSENMVKSLDKLRDDALMSREVLEKMEQIQKLFQDIATPEMLEAQKKLMEALKSMDPEQIEQAMKDFEMSQEELLDRLDRTLALLKRMQLEQKMEAMLRKVEELVDRQEDINKKTETVDSDKLGELSEDEKRLEESLNDLKAEVDELRELMKEAKMDESRPAKEFAEALEKTDADKNMAEMSKQLQKKDRSDASSEGKAAKSKLMKMLDSMSQQLLAMQGNNSDEIQRAMRRAIDAANYLSQNQEELLRDAADAGPNSAFVRDLAMMQQDLSQSSEGLKNLIREIGRQSPFIAGELEQLLNSATKHMEAATAQLDTKSNSRGLKHQRDAMVYLNKAATRLMESMDQQKQCDNGGASNRPEPGMEKLSEQQNELNKKSQQLGLKNQPNFEQTMQNREALKRLAGEQGAIRKSLEQLEREMGGSRQILGRLKDIANEMKKIEEGMADGDVGEEVIEQQLKVYSRMLEASRSLQRRDYSERRQARSAENSTIFLPPELSSELLNEKTNIEDRLRQFLGREYPSQYREQIKAYFRSLLKLESSAGGSAPSLLPSSGK